jgi:hypothetical protein
MTKVTTEIFAEISQFVAAVTDFRVPSFSYSDFIASRCV